MKCMKEYRKIFVHMFDSALYNLYVLQNKINNDLNKSKIVSFLFDTTEQILQNSTRPNYKKSGHLLQSDAPAKNII